MSEKRGRALEAFVPPDELLDELYAIESEWIQQSLRELDEVKGTAGREQKGRPPVATGGGAQRP